MPTAAAITFTNTKLEPMLRPDLAVTKAVKLVASVNYPQGCLLGEVTATPGTFKAYASGSVDGSQAPKAILPYACQTDASGNITLSPTAAQAGGEFGQTQKSVDVYIKGLFAAEDLPQAGTGAIDATAVAAGSQLILKQGLISAGLVELL